MAPLPCAFPPSWFPLCRFAHYRAKELCPNIGSRDYFVRLLRTAPIRECAARMRAFCAIIRLAKVVADCFRKGKDMSKLFEEFCLRAHNTSDTCGMGSASDASSLSATMSDTCGKRNAYSGVVSNVAHGTSDTCGMSGAFGATSDTYGMRSVFGAYGSCGSARVVFRAKNRFVRAATCESLATEDGRATPELLAVYRELACGGAGTIITGFANVVSADKPAPNMMGIYDDGFVEEWRGLVDMTHEHGARIVLQVVYGGSASRVRQKQPVAKGFSELGHACIPELLVTANAQENTREGEGSMRVEEGMYPLGPSAVANPKTGVVPKEAAPDELRAVVSAFAAAARRARAAGFDGVEIHAAHGYLLSQFLSPLLNRRSDEYGGSVENRARLTVEVIEACRREAGDDFPLFVKVNSSDGVAGGLTCADSLLASAAFAAAGASAIEVSGNWHACNAKGFAGRPFFEDYAVQLASQVDVPVILTGGNRDLAVMAQLAEKGIAAFGLCRPLICEPDLPNRWRAFSAESGSLVGVGESLPSAIALRCTSCTKCYKTPGHRCAHVRQQH